MATATNAIDVTVRLFGAEAQAVGHQEVSVRLADAAPTCGDLRLALADAVPELWPFLAAARFAVNHAFASDADAIGPSDEVALIGRVSGG